MSEISTGACTIITIKTNTIQLDKSGNLEKAYGIKKTSVIYKLE